MRHMSTAGSPAAPVVPLAPDDADACADLLASTFAEDATLRYVIGDAATEYAARLRSLIGFFVAARVLRREPMLGVRNGDELVAAALASYPWVESPAALTQRREALWLELGAAARERYEALGRAWGSVDVITPHVYLNLVGVSAAHRNRGLGRQLVAEVRALSRRESASRGVALVTEVDTNLRFYHHQGFVEVGRVMLAPAIELAVLFGADDHD
jgi:GNAT superfamily N-acetyltransferase